MSDIMEAKSLPSPPQGLTEVFAATLLLTNELDKADWKACQKALSNTNAFMSSIRNLTPSNIKPEIFDKLAKYTCNPNFNKEAMDRKCKAVVGLVEWVLAVQAAYAEG